MFDAGGLKVGVGGWGSKGLSSDTLVHSHTRDNVTAVPVNLRNQERTFTLHTENLFLQRMKGLKSKFQRSQLHFSQNSQQSAGGDFCSASPGCSNTPPHLLLTKPTSCSFHKLYQAECENDTPVLVSMVGFSVCSAALHSCTIKSVQPGAVSAGHMTQRVRGGGGGGAETEKYREILRERKCKYMFLPE